MKRRAALGTLGALAGLGGLRAARAEPVAKPWPRNQATPALVLPHADGSAWRLAEQRGRPLLLNFWASWCEPCRAEMPALEQLALRHQTSGLQVVAINYRETEGAIARFLQAQPLALPLLRDVDGAAARAFGVRVFPTTVGIARDGRVRYAIIGEADWLGAPAQAWVSALI